MGADQRPGVLALLRRLFRLGRLVGGNASMMDWQWAVLIGVVLIGFWAMSRGLDAIETKVKEMQQALHDLRTGQPPDH